MFGFWKILSFLCLFYGISAKKSNGKCGVSVPRFGGGSAFNCIGLTSLSQRLEKAPSNVTDISVLDSNVPDISRLMFIRFAASLQILDLHKCGIKTIDAEGFTGLVLLQKLVLMENKLTWISTQWFRNLANLRYLDLSFNEITGFDNTFYQMLPNLESFYFDYNQLVAIDYSLFSLLINLKKVKFGRNPWNWGYRVLLTQQLDNQRVDYRDDWEEWGWMSNAVQKCQESARESGLSDSILDCAVLKFLRMEIGHGHNITRSGTDQANTVCLTEATAFAQCSGKSASGGEIMRKTLESLSATLKVDNWSRAKFSS